MVDHDHRHRALSRHQFQAELLRQRFNERKFGTGIGCRRSLRGRICFCRRTPAALVRNATVPLIRRFGNMNACYSIKMDNEESASSVSGDGLQVFSLEVLQKR